MILWFLSIIFKQLKFMENNPEIHICGAQIQMFRENIGRVVDITRYQQYDGKILNVAQFIGL